MTTTVAVDTSKTPTTITIVTDQAYKAASVALGADTVPFVIPAAVAKFTGVSPTLVSDDKATPKTTLVYSV
jgi:hypothetical protein